MSFLAEGTSNTLIVFQQSCSQQSWSWQCWPLQLLLLVRISGLLLLRTNQSLYRHTLQYHNFCTNHWTSTYTTLLRVQTSRLPRSNTEFISVMFECGRTFQRTPSQNVFVLKGLLGIKWSSEFMSSHPGRPNGKKAALIGGNAPVMHSIELTMGRSLGGGIVEFNGYIQLRDAIQRQYGYVCIKMIYFKALFRVLYYIG